MTITPPLSDEAQDYLREMMNVGAGNATGALSELLHRPVSLRMPKVFVCPLPQVSAVIGNPENAVTGIRTQLSGDIGGSMFLFLSSHSRASLVELAAPQRPLHPEVSQAAMLVQLGRFIMASHLDAVERLCGLKIRPVHAELAVDMVQALLDEAIAYAAGDASTVVLTQSEFVVSGDHITASLMLTPDQRSLPVLIGSLDNARRRMIGGSV